MLKRIKTVLYGICFVLIAYSAFQLWQSKSSTGQTKRLYRELQEQAKGTKETFEKETENADSDVVTSKREIVNDWLMELKKENEDTAGWIRMPETQIDYPVMQRKKDDDYYLTHDFQKNENIHGAPFLDVKCDPERSENLVIYGHHMKDKTMFQNLMKYEDASFCENSEPIVLETLYETACYQVQYVLTLSSEEYSLFPYNAYIDLSEEETYNAFLSSLSQYALWERGEEIEVGTQLLTLSTCEYSKENGRLVVVAAKLP